MKRVIGQGLVLVGVLVAILLTACEVHVVTTVGVTQIPVSGTLPGSGELATVTWVIDGDTVDVEMNGQAYRVRYIGINTPERDEPCYEDATAANFKLVKDKQVRLVRDVSDTDQYGRLLRYVYVGDVFVNAQLVTDGYAEARRYEPDTAQYTYLENLEAEARREGRGCHPTGVFR